MGRHVRLEPLGHHHREGLLAAAGEPGTAAPLTWIPTDAAQVAAYIEQALAEQEAGTSVPFATVALPDGPRRRFHEVPQPPALGLARRDRRP